jgi:hypothetical protein
MRTPPAVEEARRRRERPQEGRCNQCGKKAPAGQKLCVTCKSKPREMSAR